MFRLAKQVIAASATVCLALIWSPCHASAQGSFRPGWNEMREPWVSEQWAVDVSDLVVRGQGGGTNQPTGGIGAPMTGTSEAAGASSIEISPSWTLVAKSVAETVGNIKEQLPPASSQDTVTAPEAKTQAATSVGGLLSQSNATPSVISQQRSPISLSPYVHGYRAGQVYANIDGASAFPVRRDLDSMLSRVDPSLIQSISILTGPYGLRFGPGLAYIDVQTADVPYYQNGYESHFRTGYTVHTNGGRNYGRETAFGGSCDWGYIVSWGIRAGSDYRPGNDAQFSKIPSSYGSQNFLAQFGRKLGPDTELRLRYQRIDDSFTEYAAQFFNLDFVATDAVTLSYIQADACDDGELRADTWYNYSRFGGATFPGKRMPFPVIDKVEAALDDDAQLRPGTTHLTGTTNGDGLSAGARLVKRWGALDDRNLRAGADFHYNSQRIGEQFLLTPITQPGYGPFQTNLPRADVVDPGLFVEARLPWSSWLTTSVGARLDWVHTRAKQSQLRDPTSLVGAPGNLHQNDNLYAFYVTNTVQVNPVWTIKFGGGHSQRVPNMTDRYADGVFLGIMQSGFNRVIGTPELRKERAWQLDLGATAEYDRLTLGASAFYSWIDDYNLYMGAQVVSPSSAHLLTATNAELVTLFGLNLRSEFQLTDRWTAFGSAAYLEGRDRDIQITGQNGTVDQPLYGIVPLEGRVGLRLVDDAGGDNWGMEFGARIVNQQRQIAQLRIGTTQVVDLGPLETETPGFTTFYVRGYYNAPRNIHIIAGIENLFDKAYLEHLDLRLPPDPGTSLPDPRSVYTQILRQGFSPYVGVEWIF